MHKKKKYENEYCDASLTTTRTKISCFTEQNLDEKDNLLETNEKF